MLRIKTISCFLCFFVFFALQAYGADTVDTQTAALPEEGYLDLVLVFKSCPWIYTLLILMSIIAMSIWLYSMITLRSSQALPKSILDQLHSLFKEKKYDAALELCQKQDNYTASILAAGISARKHGPHIIMETMSSEGKRVGLSLWQRISLLNEIAVLAPMVGLLGTVIGLFFAFYDSNRNVESMTSLFDGLGIAIGTTVVGLIVSIVAMILYTTLKFRIVNLLNTLETETLSFATELEAD
jgi:biopolymer transport protein ExbB